MVYAGLLIAVLNTKTRYLVTVSKKMGQIEHITRDTLHHIIMRPDLGNPACHKIVKVTHCTLSVRPQFVDY